MSADLHDLTALGILSSVDVNAIPKRGLGRLAVVLEALREGLLPQLSPLEK